MSLVVQWIHGRPGARLGYLDRPFDPVLGVGPITKVVMVPPQFVADLGAMTSGIDGQQTY